MILLDANVLLELLIAGRSKQQTVMRWFEHNREQYCISMLTVHLVLHFGLKDGLSAREIVGFLADYPKLGLLPEDYHMAMQLLKGTDHEDALQLAQASRAQCSAIVTLDKKFARTYNNDMQFEVIG